MTKKIFLTLTVIALSFNAFSQAYVKFGVGYNMAAPSREMSFQDRTDSKLSIVKGSYGKGITPALGFGYMINDNFGAELGLSYLLGGANKADIKVNQSGPGYVYSNTTEVSSKARGIFLSPSLVVKAGNSESKLRPYARVGFVLPLAGKVTTDVNTTEVTTFTGLSATTKKTEEVTETKGKLSLGYTGAFGVSYSLSEKLGLFVELSGQALNIWSKSSKLTKSTTDGKDNLPGLDVNDKETEYVNDLDTSVTQPSTSPAKALSQTANFNSLGLNVGLTFKF